MYSDIAIARHLLLFLDTEHTTVPSKLNPVYSSSILLSSTHTLRLRNIFTITTYIVIAMLLGVMQQ